ncbi:hypothetical protein NEMBOFW57_010964 [Staphylotrichum longicolle]|uniref:N-acetylgalactosaminide beta-1,3-galactosyltransferase n=1 Tax=Staphylotrichum longicolle TaxID=669026 RepID=A0AAD4ENZ0_9PEZI|nr:hypothetical protein NEMBOFW57_010964 [Staphylotrichum longicolle]
MGHGENREMIDAQFKSVSACFDSEELLVFSDLNERVHGHHAIDVLATLPRAYRDSDDEGSANSDYANYETMKTLAREGKLTVDNDPARGKNGWRLDKYKFLAGVERAWVMRPGRDFYVFYESDTYISWDNMFRFLSTLDPNVALYMGSPSPGRHDEKRKVDTWFANGGPGFVLSRGAMEKLFARRSSRVSAQFTDPPFSLKWLDLLTPNDMISLWRWENERRKLERPLLYSDLYEFHPVASANVRHDWDNTNWDRLAPGRDMYTDTLQACKEACEASAPCLQYHWQGEHMRKCVLQQFINFGVARDPETVQRKVPVPESSRGKADKNQKEQQFRTVEEDFSYTSGWIKSRIDQWVKDHTCVTPEWVYPSIERHY